ncbi:MAG: hypothetical protein IPM59_12665 [Chloracidobacterium sp.]|nr:hypothetical protein [Chloracidobacterium sp.]
MPHGTSKDWELWNVEERDRREFLKEGVPLPDEEFREPLKSIPSNYEITRDYALAWNKNRKRSLPFPAKLREEFKRSLKAFNLCWRCKLPIKTVFSSVTGKRYADIRPHFETRVTEAGSMIYVLVDGGPPKLVRENAKGKISFVELDTGRGIGLRGIPRFYTVWDTKCNC